MCNREVHGLWWATALCPQLANSSNALHNQPLAVHERINPLVSLVIGTRRRMELDENVMCEITESYPDPTCSFTFDSPPRTRDRAGSFQLYHMSFVVAFGTQGEHQP